MSDIYCPSCGKEHKSNSRYCTNCGADLENVITKFKGEQLPVSYNNGKPQRTQVIGSDPEGFQEPTKRVPRKRTRNSLGGLTVLIIMALVAVGLIYYYYPEVFDIFPIARSEAFLYIMIGLGVLLILSFIPMMVASNRIRSRGRSTCTSGGRYYGSNRSVFWDCLTTYLFISCLTDLCDRD